MLRFFRFYGRYGRAPPDNEALDACRMLAPRLSDLSGERVRAELFRILAHDRCSEVWALMLDSSVMPHLIPSAIRVDRLAALVALEKALNLGPADDRAIVRLAALLTDGRTETEGITQRLRLSRAERDRLTGLVAPPVVPHPDDPPLYLRRALVSLRDAGRFQDLILLAAGKRVDNAVDGLRRVVGVQGREDQVSGLSGGHCRGHRLGVPHFSDHDDVGIFAQS